MSTIVVVKKNNQVCIAADSLTTFGNRKLSFGYDEYPDKIFKVGDSYLGITGSAAHMLVMENIFAKQKKLPSFSDKSQIFEFFRSIHPLLKKEYFLNPNDQEDDPYESSQYNILIANASGIYAVFDLREVHEYTKFWAIGTGTDYAIGAMYAVYDQYDTAEEIARIGVEAGIEFDHNSGEPVRLFSIEQKKDGSSTINNTLHKLK